MADRRFSDDEVARILARAVELQAARADVGTNSLTDIEQAAAEAGNVRTPSSTTPAAVVMATARASGIEWLTATNSSPNGPSCSVCPSFTVSV